MDDAYIDGAGGTLAITYRSHTVPGYEIVDADITFEGSENGYKGSGTPERSLESDDHNGLGGIYP